MVQLSPHFTTRKTPHKLRVNLALYRKDRLLKIILLPGLDGTGFLFKPFLAVAPNDHETNVLSLVQDRELSSADQALHVAEQIGVEPCVLIAESYSGLVAYELAQKYSTNVKHIIFVASFLSKPSMISRLGTFMPLSIVKTKLVSTKLIGLILFGRWRTKALTNLFLDAVRAVKDDVLSSRIREISALGHPTNSISIPCTYIQASKDQFVSEKALSDFNRICLDLKVHVVNGTHFLLQTNPKDCWEIVNEASV